MTVETWTDLYSALMPQGLVKSGLVVGLAGSIPESRRDPSLAALQAAAFAGNTAAVRPWAEARSSLSKLGSVTTPVFMAQGRRDFLFGIDQGSARVQAAQGPEGAVRRATTATRRRRFPAWRHRALSWLGARLFVRLLPAQPGLRHEPDARAVEVVARELDRELGRRRCAARCRAPTRTTFALPGVTTFAQSGKVVRTTPRLRSAIEVYGSPTVDVSIGATGGWSRLVAVLTARTPKGGEILVSAGGVPTKPGARQVSIGLIDQATYVPKGSRLTLTLASSSTAQSSANLLYLDLPMRKTARARVGNVVLKIPGLRTPVTK